MTSQRHFSFSFPEEMYGSIDFIFVRSLFLGTQPSKNTKQPDFNLNNKGSHGSGNSRGFQWFLNLFELPRKNT